jgi:hypothetical protein
MWTCPDSLINDLLDVVCEQPDADACARLALVFTNIGDHLRAQIQGGNCSASTDVEQNLRELQCAVRDIAHSRQVPLPWLPMEPSEGSDHEQVLRMIGGLVEAFSYLSRRPEFLPANRGAR